MSKSREVRERQVEQYELPGFPAGMAEAHIERAEWLIERHGERYGASVILEQAMALLRQARAEIQCWRTAAQQAAEYPYRRRDESGTEVERRREKG